MQLINSPSLKAELIEVTMLNTSEAYSTLAPTEKEDDEIVITIRYVKFYILSVVIPFGLIANMLSLVVFSASYLKKTSTGHYLMALAVADTMCLSGEYMLWFSQYIDDDYMVHGYVHQIDWICKSVYYLRYCGRLLSAWLTVVITIERFIAIAYPLQVSRLSTPDRAKVLIAVLGITCLGVTSFPLYTLNSVIIPDGRKFCIPSSDFYPTMNLAILTFCEMVIPSGIVCIFTSLILWKLSQSRRARRQSISINGGNTAHQEAQITATLLAIAISFLILRFPQMIFYDLNEVQERKNVVYLRAYEIGVIFFVINYCTNFAYYCLFSSVFRKEFRKLCCCKKSKMHRRMVM